MSNKSFIERLLSIFKYLYDNVQYLEYDERQEFMAILNYYRDKIVISKFDISAK